MKKLFLLCSLFFIISSFGYTSEDTSNAKSLADQQIIMKQTIASKYGLDNKILRQEVIGMALKVQGITLPENYTCKKYFADATKNDWVCRAVELAADNGIITRSNKYANPGKYVTRAEALAIVMKAAGIKINNIPMQHTFMSPFLIDFMYTYDEHADWQANVFYTYATMGGLKSLEDNYKRCTSTPCRINLRFNSPATRAEVFAFAKNVIQQKAAISTEVNIHKDPEKDSFTNSVTVNGDAKSEIIIENGNLFLYENGQRKRQLTYDGVTTEVLGDLQICLDTESWKKNTYTYNSGSGEMYLFDKRIYGESCEGRGIKKILVYKSNVMDIALKVNENFGINFREISAEILNNNQIKISGLFVYDTDEFRDVVNPKETFISIEKIQQLGMLVVQEPTVSKYPYIGRIELTVNIDDL